MNENIVLAKIVAAVGLIGGVPAIAFGSWSRIAPTLILRFLAIATAIVFAGPTITFTYFWLLGWSSSDRGPLSENGYGMVLACDLTIIWILVAATLSMGITLAIRHRQFRTLPAYLSLFVFQAGWATLNSAFFVALVD